MHSILKLGNELKEYEKLYAFKKYIKRKSITDFGLEFKRETI